MTRDPSILRRLRMDPFDRLKAFQELSPPGELDQQVRLAVDRARSNDAATPGWLESSINTLVVCSYALFTLRELARILFG